MTAQGIATALQVTIGLVVAFLILPLAVLRSRPGDPPRLRLWHEFLVGTTFLVGLTYLLAVAYSVELATYAVAIGGGVVSVFVLRRRRRPREAITHQMHGRDRQTSRLLDAMDPESEHSFLTLARDALRDLHGVLLLALRRLAHPAAALSALALIVIAMRALPGPLGQVAPDSSEGYVQLLAAKTMALNLGTYSIGVYPVGLPGVVALVSTLFFYDPLNVLRFLGPVVALLLPLAAGGLAYEIAESAWAAFAAIALVGLTSFPALGLGTVSTWTPLTLELGVVFLLIASMYGVHYLKTGRREDLVAASLGTLLASLMHPFAGAVAAVLALVRGIAAALGGTPGALRLTAAEVAGALIGLLPLAVGHLLGKPWQVGLLLPAAHFTAPPAVWIHGTSILVWSGLLATFMAMRSALGRRRDGKLAYVLVGLALGVLVLAVLNLLHLPASLSSLMQEGNFLGLYATTVFVGWMFRGTAADQRYPAAAAGLGVLLSATAIIAALRPPQPILRFEPEGAGRVLLRITGSLEAYRWTIVSPVNQYSEVLGRGWHTELITFLRTVPLAQAANPAFHLRDWAPLRIQTPDTFIYVALRVGQTNVRASDANLPLPSGGSATIYEGQSGEIIEAHALAWCNAYLHAHPSTAHIYFRNQDLLVLRIEQ